MIWRVHRPCDERRDKDKMAESEKDAENNEKKHRFHVPLCEPELLTTGRELDKCSFLLNTMRDSLRSHECLQFRRWRLSGRLSRTKRGTRSRKPCTHPHRQSNTLLILTGSRSGAPKIWPIWRSIAPRSNFSSLVLVTFCGQVGEEARPLLLGGYIGDRDTGFQADPTSLRHRS